MPVSHQQDPLNAARFSQLANALPPLQRRSGLRPTPQSYPKATGIFIIICTEGKHSVLMRVKTEKGIRFRSGSDRPGMTRAKTDEVGAFIPFPEKSPSSFAARGCPAGFITRMAVRGFE